MIALRLALPHARARRRVLATRLLSSSSSSSSHPGGGAVITGVATGAQLHLPPAEDPVGPYKKSMYCPVSQTLFTSTHVGTDQSLNVVRGKVGTGDDEIDPEEAKVLARNAGLRLLATVHSAVDGDLSRVEQVLKLTGLVNAGSNFSSFGPVIDGCSEVLIEAFGEDRGVGARVCCGTGIAGAVSCDLVLRVRPAVN